MLKIILMIASLLVVGCGNNTENHGYTLVNFNTGDMGRSHAKAMASVLDHGLVIYAVNVEAPANRGNIFLSNQDAGSMVVPKGNYRFYALGAPQISTGVPYAALNNAYCGKSQVYGLNGGDVSVNITMSTASCFSDSIFNSVSLQNASQNAIGAVYFTTCNSAAMVSAATTYLSTCGGGDLGNIASLRVRFPPYGTSFNGGIGPQGGGLQSICGNFNGSDSLTFSTLGALGNGSAPERPFTTVLDVYTSTNCSTGYLGQYVFPNGLASGVADGGFSKSFSTTSIHRIFLKNLNGT